MKRSLLEQKLGRTVPESWTTTVPLKDVLHLLSDAEQTRLELPDTNVAERTGGAGGSTGAAGGAAASKRHVHFSDNVENEAPAGAGHGLQAAPSTPAAHRRRTQPDSGCGGDKHGVRARVWHVRAPAQLMTPLAATRTHMVVTYARVPMGRH